MAIFSTVCLLYWTEFSARILDNDANSMHASSSSWLFSCVVVVNSFKCTERKKKKFTKNHHLWITHTHYAISQFSFVLYYFTSGRNKWMNWMEWNERKLIDASHTHTNTHTDVIEFFFVFPEFPEWIENGPKQKFLLLFSTLLDKKVLIYFFLHTRFASFRLFVSNLNTKREMCLFLCVCVCVWVCLTGTALTNINNNSTKQNTSHFFVWFVWENGFN